MAELSQLRTEARQRADFVNNNFVTDAELTSYVNSSARWLYNFLVSAYDNHYFATTSTIVGVNGQEDYDLPTDFYKLLGVDVIEGNGANTRTVRLFEWMDRNWLRNLGSPTLGAIRYRILGSKIKLLPTPSASATFTLTYVPRYIDMEVDNDELFGGARGVSGFGFDEYVILDAAIKMRIKEESDVSELMALRQDVKQEIIGMSKNRDANETTQVADVSDSFAEDRFSW